jgi:hypothetical protein
VSARSAIPQSCLYGRLYGNNQLAIYVLPVIHPETEPERAFRTMASCNELKILIDKMPEEKLAATTF